jgi:hypothetical protein
VGAADEVGAEEEEGVNVELIEDCEAEGDDVGAAEVGALEEVGEEVGALEEDDDGDEDEDDEVGELDDGDEERDDVVGEPEEVGAADDGAAALKVVTDNTDRGPELNRTTEREITTTRDKISVFLLIVTLLLLLLILLSLLLSIPSSGPVNY